ncbi:MAG TPA: metallophosphoesterase family protein, partial [Solirubrobacteraceae bacterium]|nr:metallophosphoesterase family protein [Solirubrobacteraceae bacterium]
MRVAIVSDIHANLQALEAVLEQAQGRGCDELWCLGDVVGYGADPEACVALIREHANVCLVGNHDLAVTGALSTEAFSELARRAAEWTAGVISPDSRTFLRSLSPLDEGRAVGLYHASPRDPVWEYVTSAAQAQAGFEVALRRVSAVGHTHVATAFCRVGEEETVGA